MTSELKVIGLSGLKRAGKDTVAGILKELRGETATFKVAFADSLRAALREIFFFTDEQMYGADKEVVDPFWEVSYRESAQSIGQYVRDRIGNRTWVKSWQRRVENLRKEWPRNDILVVAPDCRHENEIDTVRGMGGEVWLVRGAYGVPFDGHESERLAATASDSYFDRVLHNTGGLDDLRNEVLKAGRASGLIDASDP